MRFDVGQFLKILELVAPMALSASGVPAVLIPVVVHGIGIAELAAKDGPKTGAQKKALALDAVATGVTGINAVKPGVLVPGYPEMVSGAIDTTVAIVNLIAAQRAAHGHA